VRTRLLPLLAVSVLAGAPLGLLAAPAHAADCTTPVVEATGVEPATVSVGTTKTKNFGAFLDVRANGCTLAAPVVRLDSGTGTVGDVHLEKLGTEDGVTTYGMGVSLSPRDLLNADAGTWKAKGSATWADGTISGSSTFRVVRGARLTTGATPEPVRKGATITVKGALTRANWESGKYAGYTQRDVRLQFKPQGGAYANLKTVRTGSGGALKTTVKAAKDGCFRYVFAGSSTTARVTSGGDCVDVR